MLKIERFKKDGKFRPTGKKNGVKKKSELPLRFQQGLQNEWISNNNNYPQQRPLSSGTLKLIDAGKDLGYSAVGMGLVDRRVDHALEEWYEVNGNNGITKNELKELITNVLYQEIWHILYLSGDDAKIKQFTKSDIRNSGTFKYLYNNHSYLVTAKKGKQ